MNIPTPQQKYNNLIRELLTFEFTEKPAYIKDHNKLIEEIYKILTPNWIRFSKVPPEIQEFIRGQILKMVSNNQPIKIVNACGGFKNPKIDTSPHIDYAEIFHLSFFVKNLVLRISEIYEPGAHLEYSGDAHIASYADNIPFEDVEGYLKEFNMLLDTLSEKLPANSKLSYKHFKDFYDYDVLTAEIDSRLEKENINSKENRELIDKYYERAKSNFVVKGVKDYSNLSKEELRGVIEFSVLKAYKWYDVDFEQRGEYFESSIPVCNLNNFPDTYCLRSVRFQPAPPFWQAKGIIVDRGEKLHPAVWHSKAYQNDMKKMKSFDVEKPILDIDSLKSVQILSE